MTIVSLIQPHYTKTATYRSSHLKCSVKLVFWKGISVASVGRWNLQSRSLRNNHKEVHLQCGCRIVACNLTENVLTFRILPSTQNKNCRIPFYPVHPSEAYFEYTNTASYTYINLIASLLRIVMIFLKVFKRLKSNFRISLEMHSEHPRWSSFQTMSAFLSC